MGARDPKAGAQTAEQLRRDGIDAESVAIDVSDAAGVSEAHDEIARRHGRLDILVNNAGVLPEAGAGPRVALDLEMFRATFETNMLGTVAVTEAFLPLLRASPAGANRERLQLAGLADAADRRRLAVL